ncbi:RES family NAD+ phosphorylase [Rhizobium sp. 18065]|uniref:RES family NAD+ phosphorylase n=1 Tax=Rhizobium sp. 18065 TaxID=2681411 RepID=UPI00135BA46A|nr:RES family NAD+ phosphorylase [Rhizobium sp. 18065]
MDLWRISKFTDLSGRGGLVVSGRWHYRGIPVVYCCDHPSTALLETLVHMDKSKIPPSFQLLRITCPDNLVILGDADVFSKATDALFASESDGTFATTDNALAERIERTRKRLGSVVKKMSDRQIFVQFLLNAVDDLDVSQAIGSSLLQACEFPVLRVPSAVMPTARNYLINPLHPDAAQIKIARTYDYPFDSRLLR